MAKKTIILTESQLRNMVAESVLQVMNEIDAKTYSRVHNATNRTKSETPKSNYIHQVNDHKSETNDSIITHVIELEPRAADFLISPYKNIRFMFYCKNLRQNVGITMFQLEQLFELTSDKAFLKGDIVFNYQQMNGSIIVNMRNGSAIYYHSSSRKKYPLEIDNRFSHQWNSLVKTMQEASQMIYKNA